MERYLSELPDLEVFVYSYPFKSGKSKQETGKNMRIPAGKAVLPSVSCGATLRIEIAGKIRLRACSLVSRYPCSARTSSERANALRNGQCAHVGYFRVRARWSRFRVCVRTSRPIHELRRQETP